jgi:hypothetical protein
MNKFTFSNLNHKNNAKNNATNNKYLIKYNPNALATKSNAPNLSVANAIEPNESREILQPSKNIFIVNDFKKYKYINELISYYVNNNTFNYNKLNKDLSNLKDNINNPDYYYTSFYNLNKQNVLEYFVYTEMEIIILK